MPSGRKLKPSRCEKVGAQGAGPTARPDHPPARKDKMPIGLLDVVTGADAIRKVSLSQVLVNRTLQFWDIVRRFGTLAA